MSTPAQGFTPNFTSKHSVVIDQPIDVVFPIIGTSKGHERVCRLSSLCTAFKLLHVDNVSLPPDAIISESSARTLPPSESGLPRQSFRMTETVRVVMIHTDVHIEGTLTWDAERKIALYESIVPASGITVWKLREFEEVEGGKTRVSETIQGHCSILLKRIVQAETTRGHQAHMETYHTLF